MARKINWPFPILNQLFEDSSSVIVFLAALFMGLGTYQEFSRPSLTDINIQEIYKISGALEWRKVSAGRGGSGLTFKLKTSEEEFYFPYYSFYSYGQAPSQIKKEAIITIYAHNEVRDGPIWNPRKRPQIILVDINGEFIFTAEDFNLYALEQDYFSRWMFAFTAVFLAFLFFLPLLNKHRKR